MRKVGTVLVKKERVITDTVEYDIMKLTTPAKSGSTHAAVDLLGEAVMLLSKDAEGHWLVDFQITSGEVELFFNE